MSYQKYICTLVYSCILFHVISGDGVSACDKSKCKGPIKYYEDLQCTPIYDGKDRCCPIKYNCDHLDGRSNDKCYYKGATYEINEKLKEEQRRPCDVACTCSKGYSDIAVFNCLAVSCPQRPRPGCYLKKSHSQCCDGPEVCPQNTPNTPRCEVDGKTYLDGQSFTPKSDPNQSCICSAEYAGNNVAPFCKPPVEPFSCGRELRGATNIYNNCTPAFYSSENPATDCSIASRCQNKDDRVLPAKVTSVRNPDLTCKFGDLTMNLGDELNSGTHYDSVCLKCVCEVPPLPTCQRLPDSKCDVTVHKKFDDFSK